MNDRADKEQRSLNVDAGKATISHRHMGSRARLYCICERPHDRMAQCGTNWASTRVADCRKIPFLHLIQLGDSGQQMFGIRRGNHEARYFEELANECEAFETYTRRADHQRLRAPLKTAGNAACSAMACPENSTFHTGQTKRDFTQGNCLGLRIPTNRTRPCHEIGATIRIASQYPD